ncbi:hypothetical protein ABC347_05045 [Sphingomonas sp. 1P06PA]|uniref:hypothetical protein n=1 Tax=Sphingomonas sp. 1P06PA TaxID=554121 RepID=UPI0039A60FD1
MMISATGALSSMANAGVFTDDLSRCLVTAATPADRDTMMQWIFSAYAAADIAREISSVTPEQHVAYNKRGAALFERLILVDCRKQAVAAIRNEGQTAFEQSFQVLGQMAGRGLMEDPKVAAEMERFGAVLDREKLGALMTEAGQAAPPPAPAAKK